MGELFILAETVLYSTFPALIHYAGGFFPPVLFAAASNLIAGVCLLIYGAYKRKKFFKIKKNTLQAILGITLFIVIIPSMLIFIGTTFTSGINTSLLLQAEVLFTFIVCGFFYKEKMTRHKVIGAAIVLLGAIAVLYNGGLRLNLGDGLIILATASYPFGNIYAKKALRHADPVTIIVLRSLIGGGVLLLVSILFEKITVDTFDAFRTYWWVLACNGIIVYCISKLLWYEGLKRIEISHAIGISTAMPAISFLFVAVFLKEVPTIYQVVGLVLTVIGLVILTRKRAPSAIESGQAV